MVTKTVILTVALGILTALLAAQPAFAAGANRFEDNPWWDWGRGDDGEPLPEFPDFDEPGVPFEDPLDADDVPERTKVTLEDFIEVPDFDCLNYCFKGICLFLDCGLTGCWVESSPRISHRNPDVVVSVYREPGKNPWREIEYLFGDLQVAALDAQVPLMEIAGNDKAGFGEQVNNNHTRPLLYREADAFGHPFNVGDWAEFAGLVFCGSQTKPFEPIFQSAFDGYNWRLGLGEWLYVHKAMPGMSEVGTIFVNSWGSVYRRTGFIPQYDDAKANAVIAQRVGDIITRNGQPHVYIPLTNTPRSGQHFVHLPPPLEENTDEGGVWRMIAPKKDSGCYVFGQDSPLAESWSEGRQVEDRGSVFELWRPYDCCKDKGSFIESIETGEICI